MEDFYENNEIDAWVQENARQYDELMTYYQLAMMKVSGRIRFLENELRRELGRNPIKRIVTRLKSPESIADKVMRKNIPLTPESIGEKINDIAGVRVVCAYTEDCYRTADVLLSQKNVELVKKKDYIQIPKKNGYRSLHLIIQIPVTHDGVTKDIKVEVQFRTSAMDWWAIMDHDIRYKNTFKVPEEMDQGMQRLSKLASELDEKNDRME